MNNPTIGTDMTDRATVTFHTSPETKQRLDALALATRRSKSFLTNEAVERYLAAEEDFIVRVQEGIVAADAGQVLSGTELKENLHRYIDKLAQANKTA